MPASAAIHWIVRDGATYIGNSEHGPGQVEWGAQHVPDDPDGATMYVVALFVPPEQKGRGVGRAVFENVLMAAILLGARRMFVSASGEGLSFWPHVGFRRMSGELPTALEDFVLDLEQYA